MQKEILIPFNPNDVDLSVEDTPNAKLPGYKRTRTLYRKVVPIEVRRQIGLFRSNRRAEFRKGVNEVEFQGIRAKFIVRHGKSLNHTVNFGYESRFLKRYLNCLKSDDVVWDAGAAQGLYSIFAALKEDTCSVYSFEPASDVFEELEGNIKVNNLSNVTPLKVALSCDNTQGVLYTDGAAGKAPSLKNTVGFKHTERVMKKTADRLVSEGIPCPDIAKVDIEGGECDFIAGMWEIFESDKRPRELFIETHPTMNHLFWNDPSMMWDRLQSIGYRLDSVSLRSESILCHASIKRD